MRILFLVLGIITASIAYAQDSSSVVIKKDARIDLLIKKQAQINEETTRDARSTMPGFRIQVINTHDRNKAIAAKTKVYQLYPELKPYLKYQAPSFRLNVGNFRTRQEADEYTKKLAKHFQNNVFIVRDIIEVKPERSLDSDLSE
jgi:hypothetical protein